MDGKDAVVVTADTMLSQGQFITSRYHAKIHYVGRKWLALASGPTSITDSLLGRITKRLRDEEPNDVPAMASEVWDEVRGMEAVGRHFPPGLTLERFYREGKAILPESVFERLEKELEDTQLDGASLILVGWSDLGAQLFSFEDAWGGEPRPHRTDAYYAIGTGNTNAIAILAGLDQARADPWMISAYRVYAAKKFAEKAVGVGLGGPMAVVTEEAFAFIQTDTLERAYQRYGSLPTPRTWKKIVEGIIKKGIVIDAPIAWDRVPLFGAP
ncbi:MAG TPA: hypothetical protein VFC53_00565 [Dehalococcoidia bacterium]|nr:hypothetical protein [Dehalococcoidia bacterium]